MVESDWIIRKHIVPSKFLSHGNNNIPYNLVFQVEVKKQQAINDLLIHIRILAFSTFHFLVD